MQQASERERRHLAALAEMVSHIREGNQVPDLAQAVIDILDARLGYPNCAVLTLEGTSGRLNPLALARRGSRGAWLADFEHVRRAMPRAGHGITGWVAAEGESALIHDVRSDPRYEAVRPDLRSELCVPIRRGARVFGVLNVESPEEAAFDEIDRRLLEIVAGGLAIAIEKNPVLLDAAGDQLCVCGYCRRIRTPEGTWMEPEPYLTARLGVKFSHGICPRCVPEHGA